MPPTFRSTRWEAPSGTEFIPDKTKKAGLQAKGGRGHNPESVAPVGKLLHNTAAISPEAAPVAARIADSLSKFSLKKVPSSPPSP
ncbi:unnamed protein product [Lampetra fluviatilis]